MQFLTVYILVGWIWSIYWGYLIIMKSMEQDRMYQRNTPGGVVGNPGNMGF